MSFWNKPFKATKGFINKYVVGGTRLTGAAKSRQKRLYNQEKDKYQNYAKEAQNNIDRLSKELNSSKESLMSLGQLRMSNQYKGQQLQGVVNNYAVSLRDFKSREAELDSEARGLQSAFNNFKDKIPALEDNISAIESLPSEFERLFNSVREQRQSLTGLSREEAPGAIDRHRDDVENLRLRRSQTEERIKSQLADITSRHSGLSRERQQLENRLSNYNSKAEGLRARGDGIAQQRNHMQQMLEDYKRESASINTQYATAYAKSKDLSDQLQNYVKEAQGRLDGLRGDLEWRAGKYREEAKRTGIVQGLGLAALTFGAGMGLSALAAPASASGAAVSTGGAAATTSTAAATGGAAATAATPSMGASILSGLGTGFKYASPLVGLIKYANTANIEHKLSNIEKFDVNDIMADLESNGGVGSFGSGGGNNTYSPKFNIPELGQLKQSLTHFNIPSVPMLKDLPQLSDSLGKVASLKDIEGLLLGLPQMTSASGKKFTARLLYDPSFLQKLKKLSRRIGMPYLSSRNKDVAYG